MRGYQEDKERKCRVSDNCHQRVGRIMLMLDAKGPNFL